MAHGLVEATGLSHFRYDEKVDDVTLFEAGYNRVYDSLEPEINLDHVEEVMDLILDKWDASEVACSWKLNRRIGEYPGEEYQGARNIEVCVRAQCAGIRSGIYGFGVGHRFCAAQDCADDAEAATAAFRPF